MQLGYNISMNHKLKTAFTLVELLVVIAIVGILSGLIIVGMNNSVQSATIAKAQIFSSSLRDSLLMSLVAEWKFDDGSGTQTLTADSWSGINNGTLTNFDFGTADGWRSGSQCVSGGCLQLDGVNDHIDFGNNSSLNITSAFTAELWIYPKDVTRTNQYIISNSYDASNYLYMIMLNNKDVVYQAFGTPSITATAAIPTSNVWYHVAATVIKGDTAKLYVNGKNVNSGAAANSTLTLGNTIIGDLRPNRLLLFYWSRR